MRLKTRLLLFLVPAIFVTLAVLTFLSYRNADNQANLLGHREADLIATAQSARIFDKLRNAEGAARALTYALRELRAMEEPSREAMSQAVKGVAESSKDFFGVWALWEANAYDGKDAKASGTVNVANFALKEGKTTLASVKSAAVKLSEFSTASRTARAEGSRRSI